MYTVIYHHYVLCTEFTVVDLTFCITYIDQRRPYITGYISTCVINKSISKITVKTYTSLGQDLRGRHLLSTTLIENILSIHITGLSIVSSTLSVKVHRYNIH